MKRRLLILASLLLFMGCAARFPKGRYKVVNAVEVSPRPEWVEAYEQAEECLGESGDVDSARWFLADRMSYWTSQGWDPVIGLYWHPGRRIILDKHHANQKWLVMHEAIHHIKFVNGEESGAKHLQKIQVCAPTPVGYGS